MKRLLGINSILPKQQAHGAQLQFEEYGLHRLQKKARFAVRFRENDPQGLKPTAHCAAFAARINPCPDTRPAFPRVFPQLIQPVHSIDKNCEALAPEGENYIAFPQRLKPHLRGAAGGRAKARPLHLAVSMQTLLRAAFVFTLGLIGAAGCLAQQSKPWEQIPVPKLHDFKPQQPKRIVLKNGIVVFLEEDHELPFVSGSILIPGGGRDEDPAKTGLVDLYGEAWRTSGTAKLSGDALDDLLEAKAAHIETGGDVDSTSLAWDSLKGDADQVFSLALDLFLHPRFDPEKLQLAQQQMATGIMRRNDNESGIAGRESTKLVYGANSPYTRQPEFATIGAVTVDDLKAWHDRTIGGKLIVGISGDFDPATMEAKLRAAFEGLPPVTPAPPRHETFHETAPSISFIDKTDVNQSNIEIVGLGTDRHNPDVPTLAVMNEILSGGFSGRLIQKVRTELGLAYAVGGGYRFDYDHPAAFRVMVLTKSASTVDATKAALNEIAGLTTKPFTEEELNRAKDDMLNSFIFQYDSKDKVLSERERLEFYGYPADYLETYEAAIKKVTVADLTAAAKKYIHTDKLAVLVVGNGPEIKPPLTDLNLGAVKTIDITIPQPGQQPGAAGPAEKKQ
jgi:zinc protease